MSTVGKGCGFELIMAVLNWWWVSGEGTKELVVLRTSSGYCRLGVMMVVTALCTALDLLTGLGLICDGEDGRERMRMHGLGLNYAYCRFWRCTGRGMGVLVSALQIL
ncbi:hypothetical protein M0R45_036992 [Rubus argutus]|uniref:Transmembrane protein n=1 Tax=Rubus argutus TaxID=59490 RepID=A0AAW1VY03_RUBAR